MSEEKIYCINCEDFNGCYDECERGKYAKHEADCDCYRDRVILKIEKKIKEIRSEHMDLGPKEYIILWLEDLVEEYKE